MNPFGIIADDLSGAADTGVQFSRRGARVLVCLDPDDAPPPTRGAWDIVVANSYSRNVDPAEARRRVARTHRWLEYAGWPVQYKKIDSTLRGNLAAELEEMLALGAERVVFAPAFPLAGRTVEGGVLLVDGVPVQETEFARDGFSPVKTGRLRDLFGAAFEPVESLPLEALRGEPGVAQGRVREAWKNGCRLLLVDAATQEDLAVLAQALTSPWGQALVTGSAGAARELALRLCSGAHPVAPPPTVRTGPVLVICGTRAEVSQGQVAVLRKRGGCYVVDIDPARVRDPWDEAAQARLVAEVESAAALAVQGGLRSLVVSLPPGDGAGGDLAAFQRRSARLNLLLGALAVRLHKRIDSPGIIMTGGDTAMAVLSALGTQTLQLGGEMLPGIPLAWAADGPLHGLRLVTKAGGFGPPEALARAVLALAM
jgi:uncharacterized protein YgbK (DUF1537 family)